MNSKILAAVLFAAAVTITIGMQSVYAQSNATGTAVIEETTCGINVGTPNLDYGTLKNGDFKAPGPSTFVGNTGNSEGTLFISGEAWVEQGNSTNTVMLVNQTHYKVQADINNSGEYFSQGIELTTTPTQVVTGNFQPGFAEYIAFGLLVDLIDNTFVGDIVQTVTFSSEC